jgi:hypothetical protein
MLKRRYILSMQVRQALSFMAVLLAPIAAFATQPLATADVDILGVTVRVFTADPDDQLVRPRNVPIFLETQILDAAGTDVSADPVFASVGDEAGRSGESDELKKSEPAHRPY